MLTPNPQFLDIGALTYCRFLVTHVLDQKISSELKCETTCLSSTRYCSMKKRDWYLDVVASAEPH